MSVLLRSADAQRPESNPGSPEALNTIPRPLSNTVMDVGLQPLDAFMLRNGLTNHELVAHATGTGLTHKQVAKARRGRRLTMNIQEKILRALNAMPGVKSPLRHEDCFNYRGR